MDARRNQRTLSTAATIEGIGYWSGRDVRVEFRPGRRRIRGSSSSLRSARPPRIPASVVHRIEMPRRTALRCGGATVEMVEHIMAALAGMQIDNCEVWVDQPEMPGCDGSAQAFVTAIQLAGIEQQNALREVFVVREAMRLGDERCWIEARPATGTKTIIHYELDYGSGSPIGRQSLEVTLSPRYFHLGLASSRTFMLQGEAVALHDQGLGLGPRSTTCWCSTRTARSAMPCGFPTSASATRSSTWWAISPWPVATWPDISPRTAAGIASTPSWCGRCWKVPGP